MYVLDYVRKAGKRIMFITASTVISISRGQGSDIGIEKKKSWRKSGRKRGIRPLEYAKKNRKFKRALAFNKCPLYNLLRK